MFLEQIFKGASTPVRWLRYCSQKILELALFLSVTVQFYLQSSVNDTVQRMGKERWNSWQRSESREQARKYLRGLLTEAERKNSWQVAEAVGDRIPDRMQRLLYRVPWDADAARDRLQHFVIETFGDPEGIGVVDETGFRKKGKKSVGVARQYTGTAGKRENSQVATLLSYATKNAHVFLDRELYLPEAWAWDRVRRAQAHVPEEVGFATKPEQAVAMLEHAWEQGVPMRWVTGDEVYGDAPRLRETIQASGRFYVLAVSANTRVWTQRPEVEEPMEQT